MIVSITVQTDNQKDVQSAIATLEAFLVAKSPARPTKMGVRQRAILDFLESQPGGVTTARVVEATAGDLSDAYPATCKVLGGLVRRGFIAKQRQGVYEAIR